MSCPCKEMDNMRQCEFCTVSGAKVDNVKICDVDYDYCPDYLKANKKPRRVRSTKKEVKV